MTSGHIKVKKGTGHVFYMVTPSHATESVITHQYFFIFLLDGCGLHLGAPQNKQLRQEIKTIDV